MDYDARYQKVDRGGFESWPGYYLKPASCEWVGVASSESGAEPEAGRVPSPMAQVRSDVR